MRMIGGSGRLCALLAFLVVLMAGSPVATSSAQNEDRPQCSDGIDNDSDNAIDGADAGCGDGSDTDETDSIYSGIVTVTIPLPVVSLQGTVDAKGTVDVAKLQIRAVRGSTVDVKCRGKACPFKKLRRIMITDALRLHRLERKLKAPMTVTLRIGRPDNLGKWVRYRVRRNKSPKRTDSCLDPVTRKVRRCFVG